VTKQFKNVYLKEINFNFMIQQNIFIHILIELVNQVLFQLKKIFFVVESKLRELSILLIKLVMLSFKFLMLVDKEMKERNG